VEIKKSRNSLKKRRREAENKYSYDLDFLVFERDLGLTVRIYGLL
jgi:hypothetical protein